MGFSPKYTVLFIIAVSSVILNKFSHSAPSILTRTKTNVDMEKALQNFLDIYYEKYIKEIKHERDLLEKHKDFKKRENFNNKKGKNADIYESMQGDQPVDERNNVNLQPRATNFTGNISEENFLLASRNRHTASDDENRTKDNWIQLLKMNILREVGRRNISINSPGESRIAPLNFTQLCTNANDMNTLEDLISKKIRTFYPSCSVPEAAEQEFRNEDKLMNLFFNYTEDEQSKKIATATLRLHMLPAENSVSTTTSKPKNCTTTSNEEEKLLRVSIYWYMKPQRNKRRGRKRLCDSTVISENARWVELNVANALKVWSKEQNLGLAVQVEDQDGRTLKAERYFKGPTCLVGVSTSRRIPPIHLDDSRNLEQLHRLLGGNTTSSIPGDLLLLPAIEVCTVGFPENYTNVDLSTLKTNACNLRLIHEQAQKLLEKDKLERLATLTARLRPAPSNHRHLRHQKSYMEEKLAESDTRILMTKEQVFQLLQSMNLTNTT